VKNEWRERSVNGYSLPDIVELNYKELEGGCQPIPYTLTRVDFNSRAKFKTSQELEGPGAGIIYSRTEIHASR
jgi:hypothetical protein